MRIGLTTLLLITLCRSTYVQLADQPAALFSPVSFMRFLSRMPSHDAVVVIQACGILAAVLALVGICGWLTLPVAWVSASILDGMLSSMGKIVHNDAVLLLAVVPILLSPDTGGLIRRRRLSPIASPAYGFPLRSAMVVVAGSYFFAGLAKVVFSGPAWVFSGNLRWALYASSDAQRTPNALALFIADRPLVATAVAFATVALELSFPIILFRPRLRPAFLLSAGSLHLGIYLTMGLNYWSQIATAVIVFIDWPEVFVRGSTRFSRRAPWSLGRSTRRWRDGRPIRYPERLDIAL